MANCNTGGKCHISCSGGCGCVFIHSGEDGVQGECICECYDTDNSTGKVSIGDVVKYIPIRRYKFKTTAQTTMNICASNFPAAALAQILDRILPDKILVPAKQTNVRIGLRSRNSTVSEIVKSSGFILKR
jgi:hypothetical protein